MSWDGTKASLLLRQPLQNGPSLRLFRWLGASGKEEIERVTRLQELIADGWYSWEGEEWLVVEQTARKYSGPKVIMSATYCGGIGAQDLERTIPPYSQTTSDRAKTG